MCNVLFLPAFCYFGFWASFQQCFNSGTAVHLGVREMSLAGEVCISFAKCLWVLFRPKSPFVFISSLGFQMTWVVLNIPNPQEGRSVSIQSVFLTLRTGWDISTFWPCSHAALQVFSVLSLTGGVLSQAAWLNGSVLVPTPYMAQAQGPVLNPCGHYNSRSPRQ